MKKVLTVSLILLFLSLILLFPEGVRRGVDISLILCARSLLPTLFPFMVVSNFVIKSGILPPSPFILGTVGGYPLGAQVVCDLYRDARITKREAEFALCYSSLSSPGFILGALGSLYGFKKAILLLAFHIFSAYITKSFAPKIKILESTTLPFSSAITSGIKDGFFSFLAVCSFVIFFTIICEVLSSFSNIPVLFKGLLEMSGGVFSRPPFPLAAFFCTFGGACVHFQTLSLCTSAGLSCRKHFIAKLAHGALSAVFAYILTICDI